ncbi:hypothetical protein ABH309_01690 [Chromobacterium piscinae]|uniref:Uncharacterized protein n=1 Tax=Chromobacterium piscinae TaxID=686831 RepID=A0ABV0GZB1_9NEIS
MQQATDYPVARPEEEDERPATAGFDELTLGLDAKVVKAKPSLQGAKSEWKIWDRRKKAK